MAAGTGDEQAVLRQHLHARFEHAPVGQRAFLVVLLALDEGRRIDHHDVPAPPLGTGRAEELEGVGGMRVHAIGEAVARRVRPHGLDGTRGDVDAIRARRTVGHGPEAPTAGEAEDVQHRRVLQPRREAVAVGALVVEPPGLLAVQHVGGEAQGALADLDRAVHGHADHADLVGQPLDGAGAAVVLPDDAARLEYLVHRLGGDVLQAVHAGGGGLRDEHVAEAVDGQARQAIRLTEHQAVERIGVTPLAQRQRHVEPMDEQRAVERVAATVDEACRDQGVGVRVAAAQRLAGGVEDLHRLAGLQARQRRARHVDLVAEDPEVARSEPALFAFLQDQGGGVGHGALRRDSAFRALRWRASMLRASTRPEKAIAK